MKFKMEYYGTSYWAPTDTLSHHGIKGQKWGVRRFQNANGSLTSAGKSRYRKSIELKEERNKILDTKKEEITSKSKDYNAFKKENVSLEKKYGPDVFDDYDDQEMFEYVKNKVLARSGVSEKVLDNAIARYKVNRDSMKLIDDNAYDEAKKLANEEMIKKYGNTVIKDISYSDKVDAGVGVAILALLLGGTIALNKLID